MIEIREIIDEVNRKYGDATTTMSTGEIYPTNMAPVVAGSGAQLMRWGFPMYGRSGVTINARAETAAEKPTFSKALRERRIVVPTSGFYEWTHDEKGKSKDKYLFRLPGQSALFLAGLHTNYALQDGTREDRYVILTTAANESMESYHNRMPVYVSRDELDTWVNDQQATRDILHRRQPELHADFVEPSKPVGPTQISMFDGL